MRFFTTLKLFVVITLLIIISSIKLLNNVTGNSEIGDEFTDTSTYSNFNDIKQTKISLSLFIDFDQKHLIGHSVISFVSLKEKTRSIILDSFDLVIFEVYNNFSHEPLEFSTPKIPNSAIGSPIIIILNKSLEIGETIELDIYYKTSQNAASVQWLSKEQTVGKKFPYMFTQNEPIYCRSIVPIQDTPSRKLFVKAEFKVSNDFNVVFGGNLIEKVDNKDGTLTFKFEQKIVIPSYLIAFAAGKIESIEVVKDLVYVYSEKEVLEDAKAIFAETQSYIQKAQEYLFEYEWGHFNVLVLPPAFPYGGMENPNLTFATPSILAKDKSLTNVIAHELAHSWTGNLVTNSNWDNFWLNEGFTVFIERKIAQLLYGDDTRKLNSQIGYGDLKRDIDNYLVVQQYSYTSLYPQVKSNNPDDAFSLVPYEKGYNLLFYLETLVGQDPFQQIVKEYLLTYRYKSVISDNFIDIFENFINNETKFPKDKAKEVMSKLFWNTWLSQTGMPTFNNNFKSDLADVAINAANSLLKDKKIPEQFDVTFFNWISNQKSLFLNNILEAITSDPSVFPQNYVDYFNNVLKFKDDNENYEIRFLWILIQLGRKDISIVPQMTDFLTGIGRMKFVRPTFAGYTDIDYDKSYALFQKLKPLYHSLVVNLIEKDFIAKRK